MMIDAIQWALTWILTSEVVGIFAGFLILIGVPPQFAVLLVVVGALLLIYKFTTDRYVVQRWRRKLSRWKVRR